MNGTIVEIAAGDGISIALSSDGLVYTFGSNAMGQLGIDDKTIVRSPVPVNIPALFFKKDKIAEKIQHICAGKQHVVALDAKGKMFAWGSDGIIY
jgi:alpha-tubulin suppressor-like RCC1 family protein